VTYQEFIQKVHLITGLDLESYKERQMERRIRQLLHRKNLDFKTFYAELPATKLLKKNF